MLPLKKYLFLSPQPWGKMYLSKHNYAIELADQGHQVYFLNPPTYQKKLQSISITVKEEVPRIFLIDYVLPLPVHILRFKVRPAFDYIIRKSLIQQINTLAKFDELWCFEPNIFSSFSSFNARRKLLFIVDQHENASLKKLAASSDGIATISTLILDFFSFSNKPKLLLNHGLNKTFAGLARRRLEESNFASNNNLLVKAAYVGNLLQGNRIDYQTVQTIIEQHPNVEFHFYGPYAEKENTLGSTLSEGLLRFLHFLKNAPQVKLHGVITQQELAGQMQGMDLFLTCYNYLTDDNKSSNCHKIIEYLSTGKVVVANRIMTYENTEGFLEMPAEYTNEHLPALFAKVVSKLPEYNTAENQIRRIGFALDNTYKQHIKTITEFIATPVAVA